MRPKITLSRNFAFNIDGDLSNQATVVSSDPVTGNPTLSRRALGAPQPAGDNWTNDGYIAAYAAAFPECDVTVAPADDVA